MEKTPEKKKNNKILARALASVLAATPAAEAVAQQAQTARVEEIRGRSVRAVVSTPEGRREMSYEYTANEPLFYTEEELTTRSRPMPREAGIANQEVYLRTLGVNPVVSLDANLSPQERRAQAFQNPDAIVSALIGTGLPQEVVDSLRADLVRAQRFTQQQIEAQQRFLVPGFVADGMTQGGGPDGIRPVDMDSQTVRMGLEQVRGNDRQFASYGAEVIGTYIIERNGRTFEVVVFAPEECWNFSFRMREVRVAPTVVEQLRSIPETPTTPESNCIEVVVEGAPRSGESIGVIMYAEVRRADQGALSQEEEARLRECLAETIRSGTVDPTNLCPDENCDYDRELREILSPVIRRAGVRGEVTITAISPMRSLMRDGAMRFYIPRPVDNNSIYLPAFCIFNAQGERVYRSNLLIEENRTTIEENDPQLTIDLNAHADTVRWFQMNERNRTYREIPGTPDNPRRR